MYASVRIPEHVNVQTEGWFTGVVGKETDMSCLETKESPPSWVPRSGQSSVVGTCGFASSALDLLHAFSHGKLTNLPLTSAGHEQREMDV